MSPFYVGLTAIFVTLFSWIGPVSAAPRKTTLPNPDCENSLARPLQTQVIKNAIKNPVDFYFNLYNREIKSVAETGSRDFPVRDLFTEDLQIMRRDVKAAVEILKAHSNGISQELAKKLLARADVLLKKDFGYLSYCDFTKAWVQLMNLSSNTPYDALLEKRAITFLTEYFLRSEPPPLNKSGAILPYHQFPQYSLPSVSVLSRFDIILLTSAPLAIRRLATKKEHVDTNTELSPVANEAHDGFHAGVQKIDISGEVKYVPRFQSVEDLRKHLEEKFAVSRFIIEKILMENDPLERLLLEQMVFYYAHEESFASIEYFGSNYGGMLFPGGQLFPDTAPSTFFLNAEEIKLIESVKKLPETRIRIVETLMKWYVMGGGPKHPPLNKKTRTAPGFQKTE